MLHGIAKKKFVMFWCDLGMLSQHRTRLASWHHTQSHTHICTLIWIKANSRHDSFTDGMVNLEKKKGGEAKQNLELFFMSTNIYIFLLFCCYCVFLENFTLPPCLHLYIHVLASSWRCQTTTTSTKCGIIPPHRTECFSSLSEKKVYLRVVSLSSLRTHNEFTITKGGLSTSCWMLRWNIYLREWIRY